MNPISRRLALPALLFALGLAVAAGAADPPPAAKPPAPAASPAPAGTGAPTQSTGADPVAGPAARPDAAKGSPQHFEPTEKTRADFEVSFPSDI